MAPCHNQEVSSIPTPRSGVAAVCSICAAASFRRYVMKHSWSGGLPASPMVRRAADFASRVALTRATFFAAFPGASAPGGAAFGQFFRADLHGNNYRTWSCDGPPVAGLHFEGSCRRSRALTRRRLPVDGLRIEGSCRFVFRVPRFDEPVDGLRIEGSCRAFGRYASSMAPVAGLHFEGSCRSGLGQCSRADL